MITREDLESFLIRMGLEHEEVDDGMYLLEGKEGGAKIVAHHTPPLLLLRLKVIDLGEGSNGATNLFQRLLELNATDIVHGAYGIEEGDVILSDTLELETLDFHELQASLESLQLAASEHIDEIRRLVPAREEG